MDNIKRDITKEFNYNDDDVLFTKNQIQEYLDETIKKLLNDSGIKINTDVNTNNYKSNNKFYWLKKFFLIIETLSSSLILVTLLLLLRRSELISGKFKRKNFNYNRYNSI